MSSEVARLMEQIELECQALKFMSEGTRLFPIIQLFTASTNLWANVRISFSLWLARRKQCALYTRPTRR